MNCLNKTQSKNSKLQKKKKKKKTGVPSGPNRSPGVFLKLTYRYLLRADHVPLRHLQRGHFWPHGHNLNILGRGQQGDATYQISRL